MASIDVEVMELEEKSVYGLWKQSNDETISNDIDILSEEYYKTICCSEGTVLPYIVLSRNYDETSKNFEMFIGSTIENNELKTMTLPAGKYAKITIEPKFGFLWGASIGEAKRYFYTKWLPASQYQGMNMEYELYTEKSESKNPTAYIFFAIK